MLNRRALKTLKWSVKSMSKAKNFSIKKHSPATYYCVMESTIAVITEAKKSKRIFFPAGCALFRRADI